MAGRTEKRRPVEMLEGGSHRELPVWQKAMDLVDSVYDLCTKFPRYEEQGLRGQLTRSVLAVPSSIAEGYARRNRRDFRNFLRVAASSLAETDTLLSLAIRRGYVTAKNGEPAFGMIDEIAEMVTGLRRATLEVKSE